MLKRIDGYGERWYFDTQTLRTYLSCTSFCKKVLPESKYLVDWKVKHGEQGAYEQLQKAAHYGTFMHAVIEEYCKALKYAQAFAIDPGSPLYAWKEIQDLCEDYCTEHRIMYLEDRFLKKIRKDILAFAQFAWEKNIEIINIEQFLSWDITDEAGLAGTVDLEVFMDFNRKRVRAIIDMKSGGIWESAELQLHVYKMMLPEVDMVFNWSPNDWRLGKKPSYTLKNQTNSTMAAKLPNYIENGIIDGIFTPKIKQVDYEVIKYGEEPEYTVLDTEKVLENILKEES